MLARRQADCCLIHLCKAHQLAPCNWVTVIAVLSRITQDTNAATGHIKPKETKGSCFEEQRKNGQTLRTKLPWHKEYTESIT